MKNWETSELDRESQLRGTNNCLKAIVSVCRDKKKNRTPTPLECDRCNDDEHDEFDNYDELGDNRAEEAGHVINVCGAWR